LRVSRHLLRSESVGKKYDGLMYTGLFCLWARCPGGICADDSELLVSKKSGEFFDANWQ
jgi:hypothetical protein